MRTRCHGEVRRNMRNFRHFLGLKTGEAPTSCLIKMDEAREFIAAAEEVGLTSGTSLPNRCRAALERDIREEKECCRAIHFQSGLPYDMHTHSFPFACLSLSFDRVAPVGDETQWEVMTKEFSKALEPFSVSSCGTVERDPKDSGPEHGPWLISRLEDRSWHQVSLRRARHGLCRLSREAECQRH